MSPLLPRQHLSAGGLSLLVHGLFLGFLLLGVTWRNLPPIPVEAELWSALPAIQTPPPPPPALPEPEPMPAVPPPPEVVSPPKPDIALERAEKKRQAEEAKRQEALRLQEQLQQQALQRQAEEDARLERERQDKLAREQAERERKEFARKEMEQELARLANEELEAEASQLEAAFQQRLAKAGRELRVARLILDNQERIRTRIHGYLRLPPKLSGNPEAVFRVLLLPNGEVLRADLLRGSGQDAYDREVERAILKASPLPLPKDREAAAAFRDGLILKFRPQEKVG